VIFLSKKRENLEEIKEELVKLIDDCEEPVYKVVFYSLDEVKEIMDKIVERWERQGRQGRPIDYATPDEIKKLLKIAKRLVSKTPSEIVSEYRELFTSY